RTDYAAYVAAADAYYDAILPIVAEHQLHRGGSVLLVQLENEHPDGWGTDANPFLSHLYDKARALGLEVPLFYSGLHHSSDPAGNTPFGDRSYPWFSTEFWSGWFGIGGGEMDASQLNTLARGAAKVIAFGGAGNTFYVFHGGTNLGYSADGRDASYDYRAPLGEQGQLRQGYFAVRRPNSFARAFETLLATSRDGRDLVSEVANGISTYVRRSPTDGVAVFLDNQGTSSIQTQVALSDPALRFPAGSTQLTVAPNEIRPVVADAPWTDNATFAYLATSILGKVTLGTTTYYVGYGRAGEAGEVAVEYATAPAAAPADGWTWDEAARLARATFEYPADDGILELPIDSGDGASAVFLIVNSGLSERTWFTDEALFVGPTYVNEDLSLEVPTAGADVVIYSADGRLDVSAPPIAPPAGIEPGEWQWRDAAAEAAADFPDSTWESSTQPQPFGAYGFQNGYGWYRARFTAASAGSMTVDIEGMRATAMAFANGAQASVNGSRVTFDTVAGENTLAVLARHEGLDKMYNVTGSTGTGQYAGIWGRVTANGGDLASSWRFRGG
ncbi:MAG TPA: beta-galactosidase, partial [Polyangiaceae bacterium]|nr:beta-galactosidase [Polyangiaceae bacterium]